MRRVPRATGPVPRPRPSAWGVRRRASREPFALNFSPGTTRAGNAVVPLATNGGTINVKNGSAGAVDLVLDVNGYFR